MESWSTIKNSLRSHGEGAIWIFHDPKQTILERQRSLIDEARRHEFIEPARLMLNFRNVKAIGSIAYRYQTEETFFPEGAPEGREGFIEIRPPTIRDVILEISNHLYSWLQGGIEVSEIAVLYTRMPSEIVDHLCEELSTGPYRILADYRNRSGYSPKSLTTHRLTDARPVYTRVARFKGLEATAVILLVPSSFNGETEGGMWYVGVTRGRNRLTVIHVPTDPQVTQTMRDESFAGIEDPRRTITGILKHKLSKVSRQNNSIRDGFEEHGVLVAQEIFDDLTESDRWNIQQSKNSQTSDTYYIPRSVYRNLMNKMQRRCGGVGLTEAEKICCARIFRNVFDERAES